MSFSSNAAEQREKQEKVLNSFLVLSFVGSAILHIVVLSLSSLWFKTPKLVEKPIEFIVVEPSSPKAVEIKQNTPAKDKPVPVNHTSPKFKTITKTLNTPGTAIGAIAKGIKSASGNSAPSTLLSNPDTSIPSVKAKTLSKPVKTASRPKSVVALKPKPNLSPLDSVPPVPSPEPTKIPPLPVVARTLPPLPTLKPSQTLPPLPTVAQKPPLPTSEPTQTPLLKPTSTPASRVVTTLSSKPTPTEIPKPVSTLSQRSTATSQLPFPTSSVTAKDNNVNHPENNDSKAFRSNSATTGSGNLEGNGTHDSGQNNHSGNGSLPGAGNGSRRAIATGNRNRRGNGLGSDGLVCRSCPPPNYPSGSEGIEARAVVAIDVKKDGSVKDVQIVESTGHDNLDQEVVETVKKKWKFVSTDSEQQIQAAVNFAKPGSDFERQARERERQAHELQQQRRRERQAQKQQQTEQERLNTVNPVEPDIIYTPRP